MKQARLSDAACGGFTVSRMLGLDVIITSTVLAAVVAVLMPAEGVVINKTRLHEVFMLGRSGQIEMMEHLALAGPQAQPLAQARSVVDLGGRLKLSVHTEAEGYTLSGRQANQGTEFSLAFAPSVIQGEPAGSVNLLCGGYGARPGWTGPLQGPGSSLPQDLTPAVCSGRLGRKQP